MKIIKQENIVPTQKKPRGRPKKSATSDSSIVKNSSIKPSELVQELSYTTAENVEKRVYDFRAMFKQISGTNTFPTQTIRNYTEADIERYMADPISNISQLIDINNYFYNINGFFREFVNYLVKPVLYNWTVSTEIKNVSFDKVKEDKLRKDYMAYIDRVNRLNLGQELDTILTKMCLEDCVYGYWLEDNESSTLYYINPTWCTIRNSMNGLWNYSIDTRKVSNKDLEYLPKELQSLIKKSKGKSGDEAFAQVPFEKGFCCKYNNHYSYTFPPFTYVILSILRMMKIMKISDARLELDALNILSMQIPIDTTEADNLLLSENVVSQFVNGARDVVSDKIVILPSPMKLESIPFSKNQNIDNKSVETAINAYGEEVQMPSFGGVNSGAELKRAIENTASKMFTILDQISKIVNLKLKLEGFTYPAYGFNFEILHMNVFNRNETQEILLKQANLGAINKMRHASSYGVNPTQFLGQSYMENVLFRDIVDNMTVYPSSHTQVGGSKGSGVGSGLGPSGEGIGRPPLSPDMRQPSTQTAIDSAEQNDPANRDG